MIDIDFNEVMRTNIDINLRINGDTKLYKGTKLMKNDLKRKIKIC